MRTWQAFVLGAIMGAPSCGRGGARWRETWWRRRAGCARGQRRAFGRSRRGWRGAGPRRRCPASCRRALAGHEGACDRSSRAGEEAIRPAPAGGETGPRGGGRASSTRDPNRCRPDHCRVLALAYEGITYTTREKVIDLGPLKAFVDKQKTIPLPPTSVPGRLPAAWRWHRRRAKVVRLAVAVGGRLSRGTSRSRSWQDTEIILPPRRRTAPSCSVRRYLAWSFGLISRDLVEEDRARAGKLEVARPRSAPIASGERALLVAEELALDKGLGNARRS